ncbi:GNAT family N-acetyltransferase [Polaribacter glomeratus]|uniref:GNAT family N-acetyltransferase n=1 Tax=Polaribacter glomeratus TaxID=102 RepID=A0A2S7WY54_9FLAO|nr:GNAT family N-acetyltransferase [Polaribacter glomeratus]PQJ82517.1 GNAT family N-acetyltransferase [Polaribacter glomeratus]TXD65032.1 GNAT family N-acetyltransferase [Polaribacter glomeratus]
MIKIIRTNSENSAFKKLVLLLNSDLSKRDGTAHALSHFNAITDLKYVVLALKEGKPVGCGAISIYDSTSTEIKRMYVSPEVRGQRIAEKILTELEDWSRELERTKCILFTGSKQPEASRLYQRNGYSPIEKYGQLKDIVDCLCFANYLNPKK